MSEPCIKSDKIDRLENDFVEIKNKLEKDYNNINERLNRHSEKIDKISDNNLVLETILKRLEEDGKEQKKHNAEANRTMLSIQTAMTEITFNVRELNAKLVETNNKINETSEKIDETNEKVNKVDSKSKIDFLEVFKSKIIPFLLGGGFIYGVVEFIKNLIG